MVDHLPRLKYLKAKHKKKDEIKGIIDEDINTDQVLLPRGTL